MYYLYLFHLINLYLKHFFRNSKKSQSPKAKKPKAIKVPKTKAKDRKKKEVVIDADAVEIIPPKPKK